MEIELRPVGSLTPYPNNPRRNDPAVDAVAASIRAFGFRQPVVVDADGVIVAGHTRLKAAVRLGLTEVPVHVARDLTPDQAKAYRLADNQTAALAAWDDPALAAELAALQAADVDLALTGFAGPDLDRLLNTVTAPDSTALADPDEVPDPPAEPVTRPGDTWHLGRHRLVCGDCTHPEALDRLMRGDPADLLLTDPPYNVAYTGKTDDALTIANDALDVDSYQRFLTAAVTAAAARLRPGGAFYRWHADVMGLPTRAAVATAGLTVRQCLVWAKSAFTLGRQDYQWKHEPCLYGWAGGAAHTWLGDRSQTTVLEFDRPAKNADHPTTKPVALFARLVANSCPRGGLVLDPFAGSGTALLACEQLDRTARLVELDPRYCDVIVRRFEAATGQQAVREAGNPDEPATDRDAPGDRG